MANLDAGKEPPCLKNLPEEILDNVVKFAKGDVLNLRITCRSVEAKTFHGFLREVIAVRTVWVDRRSLESLENLSQCERLAPHVRTLVILPYEWEIEQAEDVWGDGTGLNQSEKNAFDRFCELQGEQVFLQQSGSVAISLAKSLSNLPKLDAIKMFPDDVYMFEPIADRVEWKDDVGIQTDLGDEYVLNLWFTLCQAIIVSGRKLSTLQVGHQHSNHLRSESFSCLKQPQRNMLAPSLKQLDRLKLSVESAYEEPEIRLWDVGFVQFLELCSSVSELSISFTDDWQFDDEEPDSGLQNVRWWPTFPRLKMVNLSSLRCSSEHLLEWLKKHSNTLKDMLLAELSLVRQDDWRIFLEDIGKNFEVERIDISMSEERHGLIDMVEAEAPNIQDAIEDRVRDGIFCHKCSDKYLVADRTDDENEEDSPGAELDSDVYSLPADDDDDEWEDE